MGAMENLACIIFRETDLLVDEKSATHAEIKRVAEVIIHELVHMWFGDLVTMAWWTWLWLNEAFATFLENLILSFIHPEWNIWNEFGLSRAAAMRLDSLGTTHQIELPVNHPDEVNEFFDAIAYRKGCSMLYMICMYIGVQIFRRGTHLYLTRHAYDNAEGVHFWQALQDAVGESGLDIPVVKIMTRWVLIAGHPVVFVSESARKGFIDLTQGEFKFLQEAKTRGRKWPVPMHLRVTYADGRVREKQFMLNSPKKTVFVGGGYQSLVVNAGGTGFYRVRYANGLLQRLLAAPEALSVIERYNLVNDTWAAVCAGIVSAPEYLEMLKQFASETDPNVWSIIISSLDALDRVLAGTARDGLRRQTAAMAKTALGKLGYQPRAGESHEESTLRASLLGVLGTSGGDQEVVAKVEQMFEAWKHDNTSIDSNLLPAIVSVLAYTGGVERYEEFFRIFKDARTPQEEQRFLSGLIGFRDKELLDRTIELMLSEHVRTQDAPYIYPSLLANEVCSDSAWRYMKKNWKKMVKAYPGAGMSRLVGGCSFVSPRLAAQVRTFFAKHEVPEGEMAKAQMIEQLEVNLRLRKVESRRLAKYLCSATPLAIDPAEPRTGA